MNPIEELYDLYTTDDQLLSKSCSTNTPKIESNDQNEQWRPINGFTSRPILNNDEVGLSERLSLLNAASELIPIFYPPKIKIGSIGVYRSAYPQSDLHSFGYVEETRVVTRISLYNDHLCLQLHPVVSVMRETQSARYIKTNQIRLVLYDEFTPTWFLLTQGNHIKKGVEFIPSFSPIRRTVVDDGSFIELNGLVNARSAQGIVPKRFSHLFRTMAEDDGVVIW